LCLKYQCFYQEKVILLSVTHLKLHYNLYNYLLITCICNPLMGFHPLVKTIILSYAALANIFMLIHKI